MDIFGEELSLDGDLDGHLVFGPLDLWVRREQGEWLVAYTRDQSLEERIADWEMTRAPDDVTWERWITGRGPQVLILRPQSPDKPVVVRPEMPVRLQAGQSTDFFVGVPLWVEVSAGTPGATQKLCDIPSLDLSKTWFGTPQEGELCYAMRTHAHRKATGLIPRIHRCICPLQVKNASDATLSFERICLRCQHLHVYQGATRFWANAVRLTYRGHQEWSRVVYGRHAPEQSGADVPLNTPRRRISRGFNLKSFQVSGIGGGFA